MIALPHRRWVLFALPSLAADGPAIAAAPEYGPAKGALILVGGGSLSGTGIVERFVALGGGAQDGRFVIVPTNRGNRRRDGSLIQYQDVEVLRGWKARGIVRAVMLHTADRAEADSEAFVRPLTEATAVWFDGGRQWNMVDSYRGTRTETEIRRLLDRGGVVGGTSAGATVQGEFLVRGDPSGPGVVITDEPNHQFGLALLRRSAVDQHIDTRDRWADLQQVMRRWPGRYLGIGISESTAIVVQRDRFEVIGRGKVAVHDDRFRPPPGAPPWRLLDPGQVFDMKTRRVVRRARP